MPPEDRYQIKDDAPFTIYGTGERFATLAEAKARASEIAAREQRKVFVMKRVATVAPKLDVTITDYE